MVDANNQFIFKSELPSLNFFGTSTESMSTSGVIDNKWQWNPIGNDYTLTAAGTKTNVNCAPQVKWPGKLWDMDGYTYKGWRSLSWTPSNFDDFSAINKLPYEWQYDKSNNTLLVVNATGTNLCYVFQKDEPTPTPTPTPS